MSAGERSRNGLSLQRQFAFCQSDRVSNVASVFSEALEPRLQRTVEEHQDDSRTQAGKGRPDGIAESADNRADRGRGRATVA